MSKNAIFTEVIDAVALEKLSDELRLQFLQPLAKNGLRPVVCVYAGLPDDKSFALKDCHNDSHLRAPTVPFVAAPSAPPPVAANDFDFGISRIVIAPHRSHEHKHRIIHHTDPEITKLEHADIVVVICPRTAPVHVSRSFSRQHTPRPFSEHYLSNIENDIIGREAPLLHRLTGRYACQNPAASKIVTEMRKMRKLAKRTPLFPNANERMVSIILANPQPAFTQAFQRFSSALSGINL